MPRPRRDESREAFVERCIPAVIRDGAAKDGAQAAAVCNSMWERRNNPRLGAIEQTMRADGDRRKRRCLT